MNDFDYLKQIEDELGIKLEKLEKLHWHSRGYVVDTNNSVTCIGLFQCDINNINRIITPLAALKNLSLLNFVSNQITDLKPLAALLNLTSLDVSNNQINDLKPIAALSNLTSLNVDSNQINDLKPIAALSKLTSLIVSSNQITDLKPIADLLNLTSLDVSNNQINDLKPLANLSNLTSLDVYGNQINDLEPLANLSNLTSLDVYGNQINDLEPLANLSNLTSLSIFYNQISDLKPLAALSKLTSLDVSDNQINDLKPLTALSKLTSLTIFHNQISDLKPLAALSKLRSLNVFSNQINDLSPLTALSSLTSLNVSGNQINDLRPLAALLNLTLLEVSSNQVNDLKPLAALSNLTSLDVSDNQVNDLRPLAALSNLTSLVLRNNPITALPHWICDFNMEIQWSEDRQYGVITFFDNPLETPPPEIVKQGKEAVRNYFRQMEEQEGDYLFEAKLLIVGEPGAGKTTLARKLENHDAPLPNDDETTRGINVKPIFFPVRPEDFPELDAKKLEGKQFRMNIWDFGGQEIYKATHRFFLSNRSLYALVVDNRREDADFNYWLHVIEMFGGNSPLLIVSNEKQQRKRDIDSGALRQRFTNIRDILAVDFDEADKERLCRLELAIRYQIKALSHIGSPVPARWTSVRTLLDEEQHQTISLPEYLDLCKAQGITERKDALVLSQYFHDIGVFLHFQDDSLLNKTIFLKANWATRAVYKMLDHPLLDKQHGRFSHKDAATIWHDEEYANLRDELLRLMGKFFLTYEIDRSGNYIVPEKLPSASPEYPWDSAGNIYLQYAYDLFMPKGIMSQFIVEMHRYISNHDLVWKRGCVLEREGAVAEVIESYDARRIAIRLSGKNKRDFMTIIAEKLDGINAQYEKMKVDKQIPCNCHECAKSDKPFFYNHADLKRRLEKGKPDVECGISYELVNVRQLIDDVLNEQRKKTKVFVSYSHQDNEYLKRLQVFIKASKHSGVDIDVWDDSRIKPGMEWKTEIEEALASAAVGVVLVSTDFLASDFIAEIELPSLLKAAKEKGATILPLIIHPCDYATSPLSIFQAVNDPNEALSELPKPEQERHYIKLVKRITELLRE